MSRSKALQAAKDQIPDIIPRYLAGESMQKLAAELSVHRQRLYEWMLAGMGDEQYQDLVTQVLVRRISEADEALEDARIEPDTARAHARARFARMDLERRRPHLYGQKQQINQEVSVVIDDRLRTRISDLYAKVIDAETVVEEQHAAVQDGKGE